MYTTKITKTIEHKFKVGDVLVKHLEEHIVREVVNVCFIRGDNPVYMMRFKDMGTTVERSMDIWYVDGHYRLMEEV
jgi:hypothetical protein